MVLVVVGEIAGSPCMATVLSFKGWSFRVTNSEKQMSLENHGSNIVYGYCQWALTSLVDIDQEKP